MAQKAGISSVLLMGAAGVIFGGFNEKPLVVFSNKMTTIVYVSRADVRVATKGERT
jgi:hypothetical protein